MKKIETFQPFLNTLPYSSELFRSPSCVRCASSTNTIAANSGQLKSKRLTAGRRHEASFGNDSGLG